ncbi:NUDIX hydrolase [Methylobacterium terricola]|uniref:NUDIX hydrolase n=1 Tax=Methylobacterium terricola TaxID=2583531 RepID=A0A5C4LHJ8_9HYPH|nr:NUDIX hydrolase [Methylobacterium terricola]TNC12878.1 NUDIX hydrolase [Methylobacterium terricola]
MPKPRKARSTPKKARKKATRGPAKPLRQVAALPVRRDSEGGVEVLLVTSRESRRWIAPKGWPMKGRKPHRAAAIEAREEAGVIGRIGKEPAGHYTYGKRRPDGGVVPCRVAVYVLAVTGTLDEWREKGQRDLQWVSGEAAAALVQEPELAALIHDLARLLAVADEDPTGA